jgi:hypothetical protein
VTGEDGLQGGEASWGLGEVGGSGLGAEEGVEGADDLIGQIVTEAPGVAGNGAAEVEAGSAGRVGLVDGEESGFGVEEEEGFDVEGHEGGIVHGWRVTGVGEGRGRGPEAGARILAGLGVTLVAGGANPSGWE